MPVVCHTPTNTPHHRQAVASSAIAPGVEMYTAKGMQDIPVPRELCKEDIQTTIEDFRKEEKTGFRISPGTPLGGIQDGEQGPDLYRYLTQELVKLNLSYLHIMHLGNEELLQNIRSLWTNPLLVNRAGRALENLSVDIDSGLSTRWCMVMANPDLVQRLKEGAPLNEQILQHSLVEEARVIRIILR